MSLLTVLALLALIVPGVMLMVAWSVVLPAVLFERLGVGAAMRRSRELTSGRRWSIFGLFVAALVIVAIAALVAGLVVGFVGGFVVGIFDGLAGVPFNAHGSFAADIRLVGGFGGSIIAQAYMAVVSSAIYNDLRVAKEGVGSEKLAGIFA